MCHQLEPAPGVRLRLLVVARLVHQAGHPLQQAVATQPVKSHEAWSRLLPAAEEEPAPPPELVHLLEVSLSQAALQRSGCRHHHLAWPLVSSFDDVVLSAGTVITNEPSIVR